MKRLAIAVALAASIFAGGFFAGCRAYVDDDADAVPDKAVDVEVDADPAPNE
jgi:hypothetical protein